MQNSDADGSRWVPERARSVPHTDAPSRLVVVSHQLGEVVVWKTGDPWGRLVCEILGQERSKATETEGWRMQGFAEAVRRSNHIAEV